MWSNETVHCQKPIFYIMATKFVKWSARRQSGWNVTKRKLGPRGVQKRKENIPGRPGNLLKMQFFAGPAAPHPAFPPPPFSFFLSPFSSSSSSSFPSSLLSFLLLFFSLPPSSFYSPVPLQMHYRAIDEKVSLFMWPYGYLEKMEKPLGIIKVSKKIIRFCVFSKKENLIFFYNKIL